MHAGESLYNSENEAVSVSGETQKRKRIAAERASTIFGDYPSDPEENDELCLFSNVLWKA